MGARPLRRAIQRYIEDPLADFVLGRELTPGATIMVDRKAGVVPSTGGAEDGAEDGAPEVDIRIVEGEPVAEKVTVPPQEPGEPEETPASSEE
jgi:ATP-dependent Clp protease ATP-binding subunit ClpC